MPSSKKDSDSLHDLFGGEGGDHMKQRLLKLLEDAIDAIPEVKKKHYLKALKIAPTVAEDESPPELFLDHEDCNVWRAARALVSYWQWRAKFFGDRAFLPLTLCDSGALTEEDMHYLDGRRNEILPDHASGRPVLHVDCRDYGMESSGPFCRSLFYFAKVLTKHRFAAKGVVAILSVKGGAFQQQVEQDVMVNLVSLVLPVRFREIHVVPEYGQGVCAEKVVPNLFNVFHSHMPLQVDIHKAYDSDALVNELVKAGFVREGVPEQHGGLWGVQRFLDWKTARLKAEGSTANKIDHSRNETGLNLQPVPTLSTLQRLYSFQPNREFSKGLAGIEECLCLIPASDKALYMKAKSESPKVAEAESNPMNFLRGARYDVWKAACRLVVYWQARCEIFGERAYLPLAQTSEGALCRDDVDVLRQNFSFVVDGTPDGKKIFFVDGIKLAANRVNLKTALRCILYMFLNGVDGIPVQINTPSTLCWLCNSNMESLPYLEDVGGLLGALSLNIRALHIFVKARGDYQQVVYDTVNPRAMKVFGPSCASMVKYCVSQETSDFAAEMKNLGVNSQFVPKELGGSWELPTKWHLERKERESHRYGSKAKPSNELKTSVASRPPVIQKRKPCKKRKVGIDRNEVISATGHDLNDEAQQKDFIRKRNALYSRRLYHKRKIETQVLEEQVSTLRTEQDSLKAENDRLQGLLKTAESVVSSSYIGVSGRTNRDSLGMDARGLSGGHGQFSHERRGSSLDYLASRHCGQQTGGAQLLMDSRVLASVPRAEALHRLQASVGSHQALRTGLPVFAPRPIQAQPSEAALLNEILAYRNRYNIGGGPQLPYNDHRSI